MPELNFLPPEARRAAEELGARLTGVRLRTGMRIQLTYPGGDVLADVLNRQEFERTLSALMGHSLYARQDELDSGYFTLPDGSRAGICGRFAAGGPRALSDVGSVCIRIAREITGCADGVISEVKNVRSALAVSPPGMGKTTLLRDIARQLSEGGANVCIVDERGELAACRGGHPTLNVGPRTDVIYGCEKHIAILRAVRACAPDVIVTDEIGDARDAQALDEALRCGVRIVVSAHGSALEPDRLRPQVGAMVKSGVFDLGILLGPTPGNIARTRRYDLKGRETDG